jgi:hypothetical protein
MTNVFDSTGISLERYADLLERLIELAEAQWGKSIQTAEDTFLGHIIRNVSLLVGEQNEKIQNIYDANSIINSTGTKLAHQLALLNIDWVEAAFSTATLTLTADRAVTVPADSFYSTAANVIFATDEELVFSGAGSDDVAATATADGPLEAEAGEITTILTPILGITAVTNAADAVVGRYRATDAEMKEIHSQKTSRTGLNDEGEIFEAITAVNGVTSVYVTSNNTNETDADGVPAGSIYITVIGGASADIAEAIDDTKVGAIPMHGSTEVVVYNETTSQPKTIKFDVAAEVPMIVQVYFDTVTGVYPDDGDDQMRTNLLAFFEELNIKDSVIRNSLFQPVYAVGGVAATTELNIGFSTGTMGTSDIDATALQRYSLSIDDIYLNQEVPEAP